MNIPVNMSTEELDVCGECHTLVYGHATGLLDIYQNGPWYADTDRMHAHQPPRDYRWETWTDQQIRDFISARDVGADDDTHDVICRMRALLAYREEPARATEGNDNA